MSFHPSCCFWRVDWGADDRYLNLCYGEPLFAKNPSLGEGNGPRPGTKECRYVLISPEEADESGTYISKLFLLFRRLKHLHQRRLSQGRLRRDWCLTLLDTIRLELLSGYTVIFDLLTIQSLGSMSAILKWDGADSRFQVIVADPPWDIHMSVIDLYLTGRTKLTVSYHTEQ